MNKLKLLITNPKCILLHLNAKGYFNNFSDKLTLKLLYFGAFGKRLNLKKPKNFNEKLQWLKLYDRNPVYTQMVDKYEVKFYLENKIDKSYIIPTLGCWNHFDEIDFDKLPQKFVLKTTHDSGGVVICKDISKFDYCDAKNKLEHRLTQNWYKRTREWPYKNVKPRIIAEPYIEDLETHELRDYKFFCFNGIPKIMFIVSERQSDNDEMKFDYFDMDFNHLDIKNVHPNSDVVPKKPVNFEIMKNLCYDISKGIPHLRVDFYEANGKVYIGELTFFNKSGFTHYEPEKWNSILGDWIDLPELK